MTRRFLPKFFLLPYGTLPNQDGFFYVKRIIDSQNTSSNIGYILAYLDKETFFGLKDDDSDNDRQFILSSNLNIVYNPTPSSSKKAEQGLLEEIAQNISDGISCFWVGGSMWDDLATMVIYYRIPVLEWYIVRAMPLTVLAGPLATFMIITALLVVALCLVQAYISRSIANSVDIPVKRILSVLHRVETGNFAQDEPEPYQDELAQVQESLNYTIHLLDQLFIKMRKDERKQYDLQLQALHAQMNPHFLMNALNSVILLANLQGAENISAFCGALSRLMQNLLQSSEFDAPLEKELMLLEDYTLIMRYRHFERFRLEYNLCVPKDVLVPRSVLQPIIENSLQHGMDERTTFLTIKLNVYNEGDTLFLVVEDDGKGIPPDRLKHLLPAGSVAQEELKKGKNIGLCNIDQRLRLRFGPRYGLKVESELGLYTRVTIRLPYQMHRQEE